jgi:hypothetical protein
MSNVISMRSLEESYDLFNAEITWINQTKEAFAKLSDDEKKELSGEDRSKGENPDPVEKRNIREAAIIRANILFIKHEEGSFGIRYAEVMHLLLKKINNPSICFHLVQSLMSELFHDSDFKMKLQAETNTH